MDVIAERLTKLRDEKGATQEEVAEACGMSRVTIARYENGTRKPIPRNLSRLAEYYGKTVDYLLGREESSKNNLSVVSQVVKETSSWPSKSNSEQSLEKHPNLLPDLVQKRANAHAKIDLLYNSEVQELNNFIDFLVSKRQEEEQL